MRCAEWSDENWDTLILSIQQHNCILMLGPDAAVEPVDGQSRPSTEILANELAKEKEIKPKIKSWNIDPSNLAQVSQCYVMQGKGRNDLLAKAHSFYKTRWELSTELHKGLAAIPFELIVTSTPDNMICKALREKGKEPKIERYDFKGKNPRKVNMGTVQKPLVFYLYGTVDQPQSLVLTEDDFLDFLVAVSSKARPPTNILNELRHKDKSFLFLGFGFKHWYLRVLLHVLDLGSKENRSFALEQFAPKHLDEFQSTILFYRESGYRIEICNREINGFVKELRRRYEKNSMAEVPEDMPSKAQLQNAPTIFICHASEDKKYAANLYRQLGAAGFGPWLDKENIRGGNEWDGLIGKTIKEEIDYFVVLQSRAMAQKDIGYVNKEISFALDRQRQYRSSSNISFIIPVKIEDCPFLDEVKRFHTIDLSNKDNINELIKAIKRDQELRKKRG